MKIAIIGDLHIGARNSSRVFMNHFKDYFEQEFFPYLLENNIKHVVQLGDTLDRRKNIDFSVSEFLLEFFFKFFEENEIQYTSLLGNHDIYYRQSLELSGIMQYAKDFKYIKILDKPEVVNIDNLKCRFIPWVCDTNSKDIICALEEDNQDDMVLFGHLELSGFQIHRGYVSEHETLNKKHIKNYKRVYTGHYHTPSFFENINYIGTPYQITWNDYADEKKFVVLDTETLEEEIVFSKNKLFVRYTYDDTFLNTFDYEGNKKRFIKLIIDDKSISNAKLDFFLQKLETECEPHNISVVDNRDALVSSEITNIEIEDPLTILMEFTKTTITEKEILDIALEKIAGYYKSACEER